LILQRLVFLFVLSFGWSCGEDPSPDGPPDMSFVDMAEDLVFEDLSIEDMGADFSQVDLGDVGSEDLGEDADPDADDMGGLEPLGVITGECGEIDMTEIESADPFVFVNTIDFEMDPYDPADFERLSPGAQKIITDGNAGGSSLYSEVFSYEVLFRCESAQLLKTETEITYTTMGKITDLLVDIDGYKLGVSVTRAVSFPRDQPYTVERASTLLEGKLADVLVSSANVAPEDAWTKQILHIIADEVDHVTSLRTAWEAIDAGVRADTIVVVSVSEGIDDFLY